MTLTKEQEDHMLEAGRDADYERKLEHKRESEDGQYHTWKKDNLTELRKDFCESQPDQFEEFCREEFKQWK